MRLNYRQRSILFFRDNAAIIKGKALLTAKRLVEAEEKALALGLTAHWEPEPYYLLKGAFGDEKMEREAIAKVDSGEWFHECLIIRGPSPDFEDMYSLGSILIAADKTEWNTRRVYEAEGFATALAQCGF